MKKIAFMNQKGGSGKTTCSCGLGAALTRINKKILLVDLDSQAHLTYGLGIKPAEVKLSVYDLLKDENVQYTDVMISRPNDTLQLLPANLRLSGAEAELASVAGRELLLAEKLEQIDTKAFDLIIVDCPPSLGILTLNALCAVDELYIPVQTEFLALEGVSKLIKTVDLIKKRLNSSLTIGGFIGTRFDHRKNLNRNVMEQLRKHFAEKTFKTIIRENISLAEAPSYGQTIFEYKPNSHGAADYEKLSEEFLRRTVNGHKK